MKPLLLAVTCQADESVKASTLYVVLSESDIKMIISAASFALKHRRNDLFKSFNDGVWSADCEYKMITIETDSFYFSCMPAGTKDVTKVLSTDRVSIKELDNDEAYTSEPLK